MLTDKAKDILNSVSAKMHSTVEFLEEDLKTYRVGKANPAILNSVMVNYYGTDTPISQVASVTVPDARTIAAMGEKPYRCNREGYHQCQSRVYSAEQRRGHQMPYPSSYRGKAQGTDQEGQGRRRERQGGCPQQPS